MTEEMTILYGYIIMTSFFIIRIIFDIKKKKYKSMAFFIIIVLVMLFLISKIKF